MFVLSDSYWKVQNTERKGRGVVAVKEIPAGIVIGDYLGCITGPEDDDESDGTYGMWRSDTETILADKHSIGIHLINHSCTPNCWMYPYKGHTLYVSTRRIFTGEELTVSYLIDPHEVPEVCFHTCMCESPFCRGTMHISFEKSKQWEEFLLSRQNGYIEHQSVPYGQQFPRLEEYPEVVEDNELFDLYAYDKKSQIISDIKLFTVKDIRRVLRESGCRLRFTMLQFEVHGVINNTVIGSSLL